MAAPLRLALFDCDGTLVDSFAAIHESMKDACAELGVTAPRPALHRAALGVPLIRQIAGLFPALDESRHSAVAEAFFRHHRSANRVEPLYDGASETLGLLDAAGWIMGVATAKTARGLQKNLDDHGLRRYFMTLQTIDTNPAKPNPEMALKAMATLGVDAKNTVMIGDSTHDMEMARNAGVFPLGVAWGYHDAKALTAAGARAIAPEFAALPGILAELMPCGS